MMPRSDDDGPDSDFDQRPTVPRAVPRPLLLTLSEEDFARGWVGHRPSFRSIPAEPPIDSEGESAGVLSARRPIELPKSRTGPAVLLSLALAAIAFGAFSLSRSLTPARTPVPATKVEPLIEHPLETKLPDPRIYEQPQPEPKAELAKSEPLPEKQPLAAAPEKLVPPKPVAVPQQPKRVGPIAAASVVAAASKPAPAEPTEPAAPTEPEPPADPNLGVVNAGF